MQQQRGIFDLKVARTQFTGGQSIDACLDHLHQVLVEDVLVGMFIKNLVFRDEAGLAYDLRETLHLNEGLDARCAIDEATNPL